MAKITDRRTIRRKKRVSSRIQGTAETPRIAVFRSNKYIYAQAIDDEKKVTVASYSSLAMKKGKDGAKNKKTEEARQVGIKLAGILKEKKIGKAVFDRGRFLYNGRIKAVAEGLRQGEIKI